MTVRLVFSNPARGARHLGGARAAMYWVFRGSSFVMQPTCIKEDNYSENHGDVIGVYLDGKRIAWKNNLNEDWLVRRGNTEMCATHLMIDDRPYTLEDREWADDSKSAPCISCGKRVKHINDGGVAWTCTAFNWPRKGQCRSFLYCNKPACSVGVWTCRFCMVDIAGPRCENCNKSQKEADRDNYPGERDR